MNAFKENVETENRQRRALTDEELEQVAGGVTEKPELELDDESEDEEPDEIDKAIDHPLLDNMQMLA